MNSHRAISYYAAHRHSALHMIGHSHIDAAWLWPWRDGEDAVLTTFRSALNRMRETPGFLLHSFFLSPLSLG
jgi:alpha-mannosidase